MRLLDQVRLGDFSKWPTLDGTWAQLSDYGVLNLNEAVPVDITNVYDWSEKEWDLDDVEKRKQLFGFCEGLRPSFHSSWFEWRMNSINDKSEKHVKVDARAIWTFECPDCLPGWNMLLFERQDRKAILSHIFSIDLDRTNGEKVAFAHPSDEPDEDIERDRNFMMSAMAPVILAQNLMHCKNVVVEAQAVPPKLAKNFQRKHGGTKPASYRTVKIEPMKKIIHGAGGVRGIGTEKAMHIVRGNFADYSEEKPLFGKVSGRFFRAQHLRGNANVGVKEPDYRVEAPKAS